MIDDETGENFSWVFWGTVGLCILYLAYAVIDEKSSLRDHEAVFAQVQHPDGTTLLDTVSLNYSYYPATYADDSVNTKSAFLVWELRQHTGNWTDIEVFYHKDQGLEKPLMAIPLEIQSGAGRQWLMVVDGFFLDPSTEDIVLRIQEYYETPGIPKNMAGTEQNLYLVYSLWTQDDPPRR